jgi:predicted nucleic acid-binding protein
MSEIFRTVHVDTEYIFAYILQDGDEGEKYLKNQLRLALVNRNSEIQIKISFIALGETMNIINKKIRYDGHKKRSINSLFELLKHDKVDTVPPTQPMFEIAKKIKREDLRLDFTDILIVSQALCDPQSHLALFHDANILNSLAIQDICDKRKHNKNYCHTLEVRERF